MIGGTVVYLVLTIVTFYFSNSYREDYKLRSYNLQLLNRQ